MSEQEQIDELPVYRPGGKILRQFLRSTAFLQAIQGPWGSGKSVATCMKLWMLATNQKPDPQGVRRTRWIVVRNTYPDLENTTIKTWLSWFPEEKYGAFRRSKPFTHHIKTPWLGPNGETQQIDMEVIFLALEDEEDRKKLLSLEATGFWFNEAREIAKGIIDDATGRAGRFPRAIDGGPTWYGVLCDTNAPDEEHWLPIMRGDVPPPDHFTEDEIKEHEKPDNWEFFVQPPGMLEVKNEQGVVVGYVDNPEAENIDFLPKDYYANTIKGKKPSWIRVNVLNKLGRSLDGKPVFEIYNEEHHVAKKPLIADKSFPLYIGLDFGRQPAAIFGQIIRGQWRIVHELIGKDMGANRFAPILKREIAQKFPGITVNFYGDPAGDDPGQSSDDTPFKVFRAHGMVVHKAYQNNKLSIRIQAVEDVLKRNDDSGIGPGFLIDPSCKVIKAAMSGGYQFKRMRISGSARYSEDPDKNKYSHPADALQYLLLGAGEGRALLSNQSDPPKPSIPTKTRSNPFSRQRSRLRR